MRAYRIPPFTVRVYGAAAMAGGKVNALLSDNRSVPRDVYDLSTRMTARRLVCIYGGQLIAYLPYISLLVRFADNGIRS